MGMGIPFDDDTMTIIMGLGGPGEPGHHGPLEGPVPDQGAIDLIIKIKEMCHDYLMKCGKCCDTDGKTEEEPDMEPDQEEGE